MIQAFCKAHIVSIRAESEAFVSCVSRVSDACVESFALSTSTSAKRNVLTRRIIMNSAVACMVVRVNVIRPGGRAGGGVD